MFRTQFLYVLVTERDDERKIDTRLRVVYWKDDSVESGGYFVVYGSRPTSKLTGKFNPYRICFATIEQVARFARSVVSSDSDVSVELHQFDGLNDDTEDALNVDWENTAENKSSELVAFDFVPVITKTDRKITPFRPSLRKLLKTLVESETV